MKCPQCRHLNSGDSRYCAKCGEELGHHQDMAHAPTETYDTPREELTTGSTYAGRYQIIEELGHGGMGRVYKVFDTKIREKIALKLINPELVSSKRTVERFEDELKLARKISHRHVGRMYHLGEEHGTHYITMEYVSGEDLRNMIRMSGQLGIGTAINIAKQICTGLSEAHRLGIVHRDLKPSNIMIDKHGEAKIMDFGIAQSLQTERKTKPGYMVGTPEYMSPEQVEGKDIDHRSDIYAFGIILYEMVTGRVPFKGDTSIAIALKHKTEPPRDPQEMNKQIPDDLNALILKCLSKDKEKRYQNADDILTELGHIEEEIPTAEKAIPRKRTASLWKKSLLFAGGAIVVVALILTGIFLLTNRKGAIESIAVLPLKDLSGNADQEYFAEGMTESLITDLSKIGSLRVISRTSVMQYKDITKSLPEIARELKVDAIVEGSVLKIEDRVRITVKLIEAQSDRNLWAESYEKGLSDILSLQKELAQTIAREIKIKLTPREENLLSSTRQIRPEALEAYLRGRYHGNRWSAEGFKRAIEHFEKAIELDPQYAAAYAGLADTYVGLGIWGVSPSSEAMPKAKAAALKALELDNTLADAHSSLGGVHLLYEWDGKAAEKEYLKAIELSPNYAIGRQRYADYLTTVGRIEEGMREIKRARELDPLSPPINFAYALHLYYARQYDEMITHCRTILEMDPQLFLFHMHLWRAYRQKEMFEEALAEAKNFLLKLGAGIISLAIESGSKQGGYPGAMEAVAKVFASYSNVSYVSPCLIAYLYSHAGNRDQALSWLEKALKEREPLLIFLEIEPDWDDLRQDLRFEELIQLIGIQEDRLP